MNFERIITGPIIALTFLLFFVSLSLNVQSIFADLQSINNQAIFLGSVSGTTQDIVPEVAVAPSPMPELNARATIIVETEINRSSSVIFENNSNVQVPIASLTKLMSAIVVLENYNLSDMRIIDIIADSQDAIEQDVKLGDSFSVKSLLEIMLIGSSNKAAYALAQMKGEANFVDLMNKKAKYLDLKNTFFADPTGLSEKNISTSEDIAKLAGYILKYTPKIAEISKEKDKNIVGFGTITNTNVLLNEIDNVACSKTGNTAAAKGCLLLVVKNPNSGNYLINVILGADDRFGEMKKMLTWASGISK
jgi:D-alanyl-D-alanine carboxypeptidase